MKVELLSKVRVLLHLKQRNKHRSYSQTQRPKCDGLGRLAVINGTMDSARYHKIPEGEYTALVLCPLRCYTARTRRLPHPTSYQPLVVLFIFSVLVGTGHRARMLEISPVQE